MTLSVLTFAQDSFKGILLCKQDSTPIQFAIVKSIDINSFAQTNAKGEFRFQIPLSFKELHFEISAIGVHDTIIVNRKSITSEVIYVDKLPLTLSTVSVKGLSARETVKKAVDMIPENYLDSSFASFSFFRQYEKVNGEFKNLIEAQTIVLFQFSALKNRISLSNGFVIEQMRKNNFKYDIDDFNYHQNDIADLLNEDPVYNLLTGSLNPNAFYYYTFSFDTANKTDDFVIIYSCREFSSETHGVDNLRDLGWNGEGREEGKLTIDHNSFAFKKIERTAYRNKDFNYPKNNNWVLPSRHYYGEFVSGKLVTEYEQHNAKWRLKKICHSYTNEFFLGQTAKKTFIITDNFEWHSDSITHFIGSDLVDKFFIDTYLPSCVYTYNKEQWDKALPQFYFFNKEDVYHDLEKESSLEKQFENNGKVRNIHSNEH